MGRRVFCRNVALLVLAVAWLSAWTVAQETSPQARSAKFLHGRAAARQKTAAALDAARREHEHLSAEPRNTLLTAPWTPVGPNQVATAAFGNVTGRVTALALDPADASGNTLYVGTTGGGVWKSTNAAGPAAAVVFVPLTDTLSVFSGGQTSASLSIGALALGNGVLLAGTGDPNDATDSYYGAGILRSTDGGATWTLAQGSQDGATGNHTFVGLAVAGLAFSTANPALVVAALSEAAESSLVGAADPAYALPGMYWSADAGLTWRLATLQDGSQVVQGPAKASNPTSNAATSVVWNATRRSFVAAVRGHGYYSSVDGATWTRLATQPGAGLAVAACPAVGAAGCPIFRGTLAVQPATGDTFAITVDAANRDQGLYQDVCAASAGACAGALAFGTKLNAMPAEAGGTIVQGDYDLSIAAASAGSDTVLYVGAIDLYRCSLVTGCVLRNTTNVANGCATPARVAGAQHALVALGALIYLGNDGGLWRSVDGVNQQAASCSPDDATHFQNLNAGLGSLAEVVSFAQDPGAAGTLLAGLGGLGTAGTAVVTNSWAQLAAGEGGTVAIDAATPANWYLSTGPGISVGRCTRGAACAMADFAGPVLGPVQTAGDAAEIHAPWLLDPRTPANLIVGTCRVWRGPATGGALWTASNAIATPLGSPLATGCAGGSALVRSLGAGGVAVASGNAQNVGSPVLYAGMAGTLDGGAGVGGHLFATTTANLDNNTTRWRDTALPNPGGFDVSSVAIDPHDETGATVYATVMGFATAGVSTGHIFRSTDAGAHWTNISSNLPNAPANSVVVDPNDANSLYVALDTGVYVTTQVSSCASANCWSVYGTALPNAPVVQLAAAAGVATGDGRAGQLRAATYGRGLWQIPLLTAIAPNAPAIALSPLSATFPTQQVGTASASVPVTVTNTGNAPLLVSRVTASGDFLATDTCVGGVLAQRATCVVQVSFLPTATGARAGVLTVYGNVAGGQATAALSGAATAAASVVLTPTSLNFASTSIGSTSATQSVTVSNTGGTPATLQTPVVTGDFLLIANTCGATLASSTGCSLSIAFAPTASGVRSGTLTVAGSAGTQGASLAGSGTTPPTDSLSVASVTFAAQTLNTTSQGQQVTLTNAGDTALTLIQARIGSGDFSVVNGCGNSLNAHSTCALTVTFTPKTVGPQSGLLLIDDQFRSQTIALSGAGTAPPGVSLSPVSGLTFDALGVGLTSASQTITLTNNGGGTLSLASIAATGEFAITPGGSTCGVTLSPANSCTVQIVFVPTTTGARTGTVSFRDSAPSSRKLSS